MKLQALSIEKIIKYNGKKLDTKNCAFYFMSNMSKFADIEYSSSENAFRYKVDRVADKMTKDGHGDMVHVLKGVDVITVQTIHLIQEWKNKTFKNYVPSIPLLDVLSKIEVSMPCSQFKDGMQGYVELSHYKLNAPEKWIQAGKTNLSFLIYKVIGNSLLMVFTLGDFSNSSAFHINLSEGDEDIRESILKHKYSVPKMGEDGKFHPDYVSLDKEDLDILMLAANLIIYINNPNEDFKTAYNELTPKKIKASNNEYTTKPFIPIGFDAEFLRLVTTESFDVRGHWRWAAVGVGRMLRRLTFIKPHTRSSKKHWEIEE